MTDTAAIQNDDPIARAIDEGGISGQQVLVIGLCLLINMLDGFDITAMAIVANSVQQELVLSADMLGWIFSFALAGMMAGAMFLSPVSDLLGRRRTILASILLVGVSILLTSQATTLTQFIVLRFISGLGAGAMLASQATLAAEYSPERYRALAVALVTSGYPMGAMLTSVVASGVLPELGWRGMFLIGGGSTLVMAVVAWRLLPESLKFLVEKQPPGALQRVNAILAKMGKPAVEALPASESPSRHSGFATTMLQLLQPAHRKTTLLLWVAFLCSFASLYFLMSWIPKLLVDAGYTEAVGRQAFFLFNLGGVVGIYLMGALSTRLKLTNIVSLMLVAASLGMVAFALAPTELSLLLAVIFAIGVLQQGGFTGMYSAAAKAYPTAIRNTGIGWAIGLGRSGAVIGPAVAGYLIVFGFDMTANFLIFAIPTAISGLFAYFLHIR